MHKHSDVMHRTQRPATGSPTLAKTPKRKALPLCLSMALAAGAVLVAPAAYAGMAGMAGMAVPGANTGTVSVTALTSPTGGTVVGGIGSISQNGSTTVINQVSNKLALDWLTFNVGKDATVQFNQPSFTAVALNRILDQNPSQIFGRINSNGQVFLINTHGIIFGSTAQVNVGGLVASTLDLTPTDFLADHFNLDAHGGSAGVVNHGTIAAASGGSVTLLGGSVANDGLILANYGNINLDGADKAVLDFDGNGLITVQVTGELKQRLDDRAAVSNDGTLDAEGGTVVLEARAAKDLFTDAVNNSGVIHAGGIRTDGGTVRLVASGGNTVSSGSIDVSGVHGGSAQLLSDANVGVTGSIDASGTQGGGNIRVGGGWQGGEGLQRSAIAYVGPQAVLKADATRSGRGGSVVVWSDRATGFMGEISARGGAQGGDGGRAEVSSHGYLQFDGHADLRADHGAWGSLLLDPGNVTISNTADSGNAFGPGGTFNEGSTDADSNIAVSTLLTQLGSSDVSVSASGDIGVQNSISYTGSNNRSLSLTAGGTLSFATDVVVAATGSGTLSGVLSGDTGVTFESGSGFTTSGGTLSIGSSGGAVQLGTLSLGTGSLTVNGSAITQVAGSTITQAAGGGANSFNAGGGGALTLANTGNDFSGAVSLTGGTTQVSDQTDLTLGTLATGALTVSSGGALVLGSGTVIGKLDATGATSIAANGPLTGLSDAAFTTPALSGSGSLAGSGTITGLGSTAFDLTGNTTGTYGGITFSGFTAADATLVSGAAGFDDGNTSSRGMTFAAATNVIGTGAISNVAGSFADDTLISAASGIGYAGFASVTGTGGAVTGVTGNFDVGTQVSASSGVDYSGFALGTVGGSGVGATITGSGQTYTLDNAVADKGSSGAISWTGFGNIDDGTGTVAFGTGGSLSGNVTAQTLDYGSYVGAVNFNLSNAAGSTTGIGGTWSGVTSVAGNGSGATIVGSGQTYALDDAVADQGSSGAISWTGFGNIDDSTGTVAFGTGGSVSGNITAQMLDFGSYSSAVNFDLSHGVNTTTGIGGSWSGVTSVAGSGNSDTIIGTNQTYTLTGTNAGNNGTVSWTSFENLQDSGIGTLSAVNQTWSLSGHDQGTVTDLSGSFAGIGNLLDSGTGHFVMHAGADGDISGNLDAGSGGSIDYTGYSTPVDVNLSSSGTTGVGGSVAGIASITASSNLGVSGTTAGSLDITNTGAGATTSLGALSVGSNLGIVSSGAVSQSSNALSVTGTTTINAGSNDISLANPNNDFTGAVSLTGGATQITDQNLLTLGTLDTRALTVNSSGALNLGSGSIDGDLVATSNNGAITEAPGGLQVSGTSNLQAGTGAITLADGANHFTAAVTAAGQGVTLIDSGDLTIASLSNGTDGRVNLTAGGALMLPSSAIDTGMADLILAANGGALTLPGTLSGANVTLRGRDGVTLNSDLTASSTATLTSSAGAINQLTGVITAGTLTGSSQGSTTLGQLNLIGQLGDFSAAGFSLTNAQNLTVSGAVDGGSGTSLTTIIGNLVLDNDLSGTNTMLDAGGAISQSAGIITAGTLSGSAVGDASLTGNNRITTLGSFDAANLSLSNAQALTVNGPLTVPGTLRLTTTAGGLAFNTDLSAGTIVLDSATDLVLTNNLSATDVTLQSGGGISQSAGIITASTLSGGAVGDTTLGGANLIDALGSFSAANLALTNAQALTVNGPLTLPGTLSLTTTAGTLDLASDLTAGTVNLDVAAALNLTHGITADGLSLLAGGAINQTGGALTVSGTTTVDANGNAISLAATGNDFAGAVNLAGGTTQVTDANTLTLGTLSTGALTATSTGALTLGSGSIDGDLVAISNNGAITEATGGVRVTGTSNLQAGAGSINLIDGGNHFTGAVSASGQGVTLIDSGDLTIASLSSGTNGTVNLVAGGALNLPASGIDTGTADLTLAANGGSLVMPGALSGANVTLSGRDGIMLDNDISSVGTVTLTSSSGAINQSAGVITAGTLTGSSLGDTTLNNPNLIDTLGSFSAANLSLINAQGLTVNGPLTVPGALSLTTTSGGLGLNTDLSAGAITLDTAADLGLTKNLSATNVALTSGGAISQIGGVITAGTLTGSSTGDTTLTGANLIDTLGSFAAANLSLINAQGLAVNGPLTVPGALSLTTTSGGLSLNTDLSAGAITLDTAADLGLTKNLSATNVALTSGGAISQIGGVITAGTLTGSSTGDTTLTGANLIDTLGSFAAANLSVINAQGLTVNGPLTVPGALSLTTTLGGLSFNSDLNAGTITLDTAADLDLTKNLSATNVALSSGGAITQSGGVITAGTLTGSSFGGTTLNNLNLIDTLGSFSAANLTLTNAQGLTVNGPLTVPGALSLTTTSGGLSFNTDLSAGAITLDTAADMDLTKNLSATNVALSSGGAITQSGGVITASTLTGSSTGDTTLTGANLIDTLGSFSAANLSLTNAQGLTVNGPLTVPGALSLTTTSGGLSLNTDLSAGAITLDTAADLGLTKNLSATNVALTSGGAISQIGGVITAGTLTGSSTGNTTLTGANLIDALGSFAAVNLSLTNAQGLAVNGPLTVPGALSLTTTLGGLSLNTDLSAGTITLDTAADLDLTKNLSATNVALTSGGAITGSGVITAGTLTGSSVGNTTLTGANLIDTLGGFAAANLSVINAQGLTVNGPLTVPGALSLTTTSGGLSLNTDLSAGAITLDTAADLDLTKNLSATNVALTSGSAITQSGGVITAGTLTGSSFGGTTLNNLNLINTLGSFSAANLSLTNAQGLAVNGPLTVPGALSLTTTSGGLSFNTDLSAGTITLDTAADMDLTKNLSATNVALTSGGAISQSSGVITAGTLSGSSVGNTTLTGANLIDTLGSFAAANLSVINAQGLTVNGPLTVPGALTLTTTSGGLSFNTDLSAGAITLDTAADLDLTKNLSATNVALTSGGAITGSGVITAGTLTGSSVGNTTLTGANLIDTLGSFAAANLSVINAQGLTVNGPLTVPGALSLTTTSGGLSLNTDLSAGAITLDTAADLELTKNLSATNVALSSGGAITQSGGVITAGTLTGSSFGGTTLNNLNLINTLGSFSAANLSLTNAQGLAVNGPLTVPGALSLTTTSGGLSFNTDLSAGTITLDTAADMDLTKNLSATNVALTSGGAISQSGGVITAGTLTGSSTGDTTLTGANLIDTLGSFAAANLSVINAQGLAVNGPLTVPGALSLTTTLGGLSLNTDLSAGTITLDTAADLDLTKNLSATNVALTSGGAITQSGGVIAAGTLTGSSVGNTTLTGANQINTLGSFSAANLSLTNAQGLAVNGPLTVPGALSLTTTSGGLSLNTDLSAGAITLDTAADLDLTKNLSATTVSLTSGGAIDQNGGVITAGTLTGSSVGNTTLTGANLIDTLGSFAAANLSVINAQGLTVNGPLTVPGALSLTTTLGGLSFNSDLNAGTITLDTAADLDLTKNLSATNVALSSGGAITQSGGVITAGTLTGSSFGGTTLNNLNLIDTLGSFSAANLSLTNAQGLAVNGPLTVPGALSLTTTSGGLSFNTDLSAGAITLYTAADMDLTKNLSATNVALTSGGAITQSGGVIIAGTLTGSSTGDTTLTGANLIDTLGSFAAANMSLQNAQSLSVTGAVSTVGGTGAIALTTTSGSLGVRHALSGGTIALAAAGDLLLADNIAALDVSLISGGDLAQTGGIIQASTLSGSAAGSATLQQANKVATLGDFAATAGLAFANSQSLRVGGSVDGGSATRLATSAGSLSIDGRVLGDGIQLAGQDGLLINGAVDAGAGELDLSSMGGTITEAASGSVIAGSLSGSSFGDTTLTGANQVATLGNFTSGGNFSLRDLRTLTVNSPLSINAGNGDLALSTVGTGSDLILATDLQGGKVTLVSGRDIKQAGSGLRAVSLTGSAGRDVLLTGSNHVSTLGDFSAASFNLTNAQNLAVGGTVATGSGALQLATTSGALSVTGALEGGAVSLASAGDLALDGGVTADVLALQSGGAIGQGASGVITANSLSGQSIGSTTLEGANRVGALGSFSADGLRFANAVGFSVTGPVDGGSATTLTTTAGDLLLQGEVRGATTTLRSAGAITESGSGIVVADQLTGRASGIATLAGANRVGTLGAFDAAGLNLSNAGTLVIAGPVVISGTTRLATTTGDLHVDGSIDSSVLRLESAGAISEGNGGVITAGTLSGSAAGITTLGTRAQPIANHVDTLGNFSSPAGFSFTNAQTLTLASVQGSTFTIDAGHAALYLGITGGDLLQSGETPMYDGAGTFFSSGRMGTALAPLYVIGDSAQVIADVGVPPAYFYALDRQGNFLPLTGDLSFNVPTSLFFGKAQNGNGRGDAYIDPSVISANYRSFGIVPSGILLPEDQQQCQPELEDCSDE